MRQFILFLLLIVCACKSRPSEGDLANAMRAYDQNTQSMNADALADMYLPDGILARPGQSPVQGRDAIRQYLSSFKNVSVFSSNTDVHTVIYREDTAVAKGVYRQTVVADKKDTIQAKGKLTATWVWVVGKGWRIKSMVTMPE